MHAWEMAFPQWISGTVVRLLRSRPVIPRHAQSSITAVFAAGGATTMAEREWESPQGTPGTRPGRWGTTCPTSISEADELPLPSVWGTVTHA